MGLLSSLFGGGDDNEIERPTYYSDADYTETQAALKSLGLGLLSGEIPDYYSAIGETGSDEFEQMLGLTTRDIQQSAAESAAATGRGRGGSLAATTAQAVADAAIKARYSDYVRALTGKQNLLNTGVSVTSGVRSAGQAEERARNAFNWNDYNAQLQERAYQDAQDEALGELIGTIASVGLGAATGGLSLGAEGVIAGSSDALSGTNFLSTLLKSKKSSSGTSYLGAINSNSWIDELFSDDYLAN